MQAAVGALQGQAWAAAAPSTSVGTGQDRAIIELEKSPIAAPFKKRANAPSVGLNRAPGTVAGV